MAFKTNEFQQITMDDRFRSLTPRHNGLFFILGQRLLLK